MKKWIFSVLIGVFLCGSLLNAADLRITDLSEDTSPTYDDLLLTVDSPAGVPVNKKVTLGNLSKALGWVDVRAYGAKGDGVTDDGPAIQNAINSAEGIRIFMPPGQYGIGTPIIITNKNFILSGASRVYTDIFPLATDIHVGSGPNALIINSQNITNCIIENIRFRSAIAFTGWAIWAEDGVQGGQALFSSTIQNCWIGMGTTASGFFHGGAAGCFFLGNEFENTGTGFHLRGAGNNGTLWDNNHWGACSGPFIDSDGGTNHIVRGIEAETQLNNWLLYIVNGTNWIISEVMFNFDPAASLSGGFIYLDTCTEMVISNFRAKRLSGSMAGIYLNATQAKISNGFIINALTVAACPYSITINGAGNKIDISNVTIQGGTYGNIGFGKNSAVSGDISIKGCTLTKSGGSSIDYYGTISANIEIDGCSILDGQYNVGVSTVAMVNIETSGRFYLTNNTIGITDVLSTPVALFNLLGSGQLVLGGNRLIGSFSEFKGTSTQTPTYTGINVGGTSNRSGAATPVAAVTPFYIGENYLDSTAVKWYKSTGLTNTDWVALN